jgi:cell division septation protein DedD
LFRLNTEQKIEFEYIPTNNFLNDSFGLPELITRPVVSADAAAGLRSLLQEKQADRAVSTAKPTLRRKIRKIYDTAAVLAIAGLSCSALYFISLQTDYNLSSLNPIALFGQPVPAEKIASRPVDPDPVRLQETLALEAETGTPESVLPAVVAAPVAATEQPVTENAKVMAAPAETASLKKEVKKAVPLAVKEKKKEVATLPAETTKAAAKVSAAASAKKSWVPTIKSATNRYYIIAGGYSSLKNARWGLKQLTRQGGNGKVLLPATNGELHRVSVSDFASKEEALQKLPELKQKFGNNIWILNY